MGNSLLPTRKLIQSLVLLAALLLSSSVVQASIVRVDLAAFRNILDIDIDGTAESILFEYGLIDRGTSLLLVHGAGVLVKETLPLNPDPKHVRVPFAEYDISTLAMPIASASLNFKRFFQSNFSRMGRIQVSGYAADGVVMVSDYDLPAQILGLTGSAPSTGNSQSYSIDVSDFLRANTGNFVGFRFDMTARGGAYLLDNSYLIRDGQEATDWINSPAPFLSIETASATIPIPGTALLMMSALGLLGYTRSQKRATERWPATYVFSPSVCWCNL